MENGESKFKSQCSSCLGWSYSKKNVMICTLCCKPVHSKCLKGELGCVSCCTSTIPGYLTSSYELNENFNSRVTQYYNPYERSSIINLIGEKNDEGRLYEANLFNNVSEILSNCRYQQPNNVKYATKSELKVFSLNVR